MDANKKVEQLEEVVIAVGKLLDELVSRRSRPRAVVRLKVAIALYVRIAYSLGSEHIMHDIIDGDVTGAAGNGHSDPERIK